jgi:hypothetical protein
MTEDSGLPPWLDSENVKRTGLKVLDEGLPALPDVFSHQMLVPVACWKATTCAVVLFLRYSRFDDGTFYPSVTMGSFYREHDRWAWCSVGCQWPALVTRLSQFCGRRECPGYLPIGGPA